jgi:hypothetical protein
MHRRGTTRGCNGLNNRVGAVRIETGESYRDTLAVSTFAPWAAAVPLIKLVAGCRNYVSHAVLHVSAVLRFLVQQNGCHAAPPSDIFEMSVR